MNSALLGIINQRPVKVDELITVELSQVDVMRLLCSTKPDKADQRTLGNLSWRGYDRSWNWDVGRMRNYDTTTLFGIYKELTK